MRIPTSFYVECTTKYHEIAKTHGFAQKGIVIIPELKMLGSKICLWFYQSDQIQQSFSSPELYYYTAVANAIECGIVLAYQWHEDFSVMTSPSYLSDILSNSPQDKAEEIYTKELGIDEKSFNDFCMEIFVAWMEEHEPYWALAKPADYTLQATVAAFQVGVSMILYKLGY